MKNTVILSLETYNNLMNKVTIQKQHIDLLKEKYNKTKEKDSSLIETLHNFILERCVVTFQFDDYKLESLTDINKSCFAMAYKDDLLKLGITEEEMIKFITDKYNYLVEDYGE